MATAESNWNGGTATQTQVATLTPGGTIEVGDEFDVILTAEDGSVSTAKAIATGTSVAQVVTDIYTTMIGLSKTTFPLFAKLNWSDDVTSVGVTAKIAGEPFYLSEATFESGGGAADAQTFVAAVTTINKGPYDWNTLLNHSTGVVPTDDDNARLMPHTNGRSYPVLYGLQQASVALKSLRKNSLFKADFGDVINNYRMRIDVDSVVDSNVPEVVIDGSIGDFLLEGICPQVNIYGTSQSQKAVELDGDIGEVICEGHGVRGKISVLTGAILDRFFVLNCPLMRYDIGEAVTSIDEIDVDSGDGDVRSDAVLISVVSAAKLRHHIGLVTTFEVRRGGLGFYNGNGTLTLGDVRGGVFDFTENVAVALTVTQVIVRGGELRDTSGRNSITWDDVINRGGVVNIGRSAVISVT